MPFLYVGNLGIDYDQEVVEKDFSQFGKIRESWHWPTFGYCFFEYDSHRDAEDAVYEMNGSKSHEGKRMSVQWARRPRKHLPSRATSNDKCYVCNRYGHFARDCPDIGDVSPRSSVRRSPPRTSSSYRGRHHSPLPRTRSRYSRSPPRRRSRSPRRRSSSRSRSPSPLHRRTQDKFISRSRSRSPYRAARDTRCRLSRSYSRSPGRR